VGILREGIVFGWLLENPRNTLTSQAGLLGPKTVQAHVTSLTPSLIELVKKRGVTLAHCPLYVPPQPAGHRSWTAPTCTFQTPSSPSESESSLGTALRYLPTPRRSRRCRALDAELKVGLGSDIAGGYALSLQTAMRQAVAVSRLREGSRREIQRDVARSRTQAERPERPEPEVVRGGPTPTASASGPSSSLRVDWIESLYVATRGGKKAMGLGGCFEVGMEFDAQKSELCGAVRVRELPRSAARQTRPWRPSP
jgi:guanine deaminase